MSVQCKKSWAGQPGYIKIYSSFLWKQTQLSCHDASHNAGTCRLNQLSSPVDLSTSVCPMLCPEKHWERFRNVDEIKSRFWTISPKKSAGIQQERWMLTHPPCQFVLRIVLVAHMSKYMNISWLSCHIFSIGHTIYIYII